MNNFKDYLNLSPNTRDNFYNLSRMTGEQEYYMKLCESLQQKINILEAKMKKKKKNKKADKDYDGDGKVESGKEEYFGSKDKAIKAAMEKKKSLKEGREVIGGGFIYGGFPRKLNEGGVVSQFNDADDTGNDEKIATKPDGEPALWSDESLVHGHYRYPSKELMDLAITADTLQREYLSKRAENRSFEGSPEGRKLGETLHTAKMELYKHPHYTEFRKGHPSRRNRPIISATFSPDAVIDTSREGT